MKSKKPIITDKMIQEHLSKMSNNELELINSVSEKTNIPVYEILGASQKREVVDAKKILTLILDSDDFKYTSVRIGQTIRAVKMNHSTILRNMREAVYHYERDESFKNIVDSLKYVIPKINSLIAKNN